MGVCHPALQWALSEETISVKILVMCVINSSRHKTCFIWGCIHSMFVSKGLTRSYLARSGFDTACEYNPVRNTFYDVNYIYSTVVKVLNNLSDLEVQAKVDNCQSFEVGSVVEVPRAGQRPRYGVIRWIGTFPTVRGKVFAGLELVKTAVSCLAPLIILLFTQNVSPLLIRLNPLCVAPYTDQIGKNYIIV